MSERTIACILSDRWVGKVGKYVVKLGFRDEKAEEVWMTERQLTQLEQLFEKTPHRHSTDRIHVIGIWNERGYYTYARLEKISFIEPVQYNLKDLEDEP